LPSVHSAKSIPSTVLGETRQRDRQRTSLSVPLPSAKATALSKEVLPVPRCAFFAECYGLDTRQSDQYTPFYLFLSFHPNKTKISHNHHRYHISHKDHKSNKFSQSITNMFEHKHKYPTLKNISLKYLTKHYQHQTSSDQVISQSINNTNRDNIMCTKYLIEVGCWTGAAMGWAIHEGCWMPPQIDPTQRRDCMCYTR
jgi:hypothetical protein